MKFKMESLSVHSREMGDRGITEKESRNWDNLNTELKDKKEIYMGNVFHGIEKYMRNKGGTCHEWRRF